MNREIRVVGTENDRTKFVTNRDKGYINGMTDFINVEIPAHSLVPLKRACEIFDCIDDVPELNWLKMTEDCIRIVENNKVDSDESYGRVIARLLAEGQVLSYETPFGVKSLRAKHIYNAVACSMFEESDMTSSSFYGYVFWSNRAKSNFVCRIFFGTSGVYL